MMQSISLCRLRETDIRLHPLLPVVAAGACVLGRLDELAMAFVALLMHELCHMAAARAFGCRVLSLDLLPFGGALRLERYSMTMYAEWCVALIGPVASFVLAGLTAAFGASSPYTAARLMPFMRFNLVLGSINLLPALPLDGGRAVKCLLQSRVGLSRAVAITAWTGVAAGSIMLLIFLLAVTRRIYNLTLPVMGLFLLLAAIREINGLPEQRLYAYGKRGAELRSGEGVRVSYFAVCQGMRAADALKLLRDNRFSVLRVIDEGLSAVGEIDETALILGMARLGSGASLEEILKFDRARRM